MELSLYFTLFLSCVSAAFSHQNAPPGVPPSRYQDNSYNQPPPPQYQQPPPQQYQQHQPPPPQQYQPPPPQQHQQPPPQQYQQHQQPPSHHSGGQAFHPNDIKESTDHIKHHMDTPMDTSNMSDEELQFHYFKMHDSDGNSMLDGTELIHSILHWQDEKEYKIFQDNELSLMIDQIMGQDDADLNGLIDYEEFRSAQLRTTGKPST